MEKSMTIPLYILYLLVGPLNLICGEFQFQSLCVYACVYARACMCFQVFSVRQKISVVSWLTKLKLCGEIEYTPISWFSEKFKNV